MSAHLAEGVRSVTGGYADVEGVTRRSLLAWKPPRRLSLSEWADDQFVMSAETSAEPGRWKTIPYQRGIMDAITDPAVEQITVMKSSRIGFTLMMSAAIGYFIDHDPSSMLVVQPTVDDSKNFSKETVAAMLRDVPCLRGAIFRDGEKGAKDSSNTLTHKKFRGGVLSLTGANSGTGFRRIGRRVLLGDEVDAYPPSAGPEGDPLILAKMRTQAYWNRKHVIGSTPLIAGASRIAEEFEKGDQRRYYVPCPQCGHMDFLTFREQTAGAEPRGHYMKWPDGKPREAFFICRKNGCVIEHKDKRPMIERGEWRADAPFVRHASFHVWAAYSYMPNSTWGDIAEEFLSVAKGGTEKLKTFVNTVLGECWVERGDAPEWQRLYQRREDYPRGRVPSDVAVLTAGVDVQKDRLVWEVVGWGEDRQSWSIDAGVIPGDTSGEEAWTQLDELLGRAWPDERGTDHRIRVMGVDSGFNTQAVYNWARRNPGRVIACKGVSTAKTLISSPTPVDVKWNGKRIARGCKVWPIGVDVAKGEFYGWLRLEPPTSESGDPYPAGYCHLPEYGEDYFKQITAEHLVPVVKRTGFTHHEWQVVPGRENHWLDARVYARAAAALAGLDRLAASRRARPAAPVAPAAATPTDAPAPLPPPVAASAPAAPARGGWLGRPGGATLGGGGWLYSHRRR